jgi:hypothetical protein
MLSYLKSDEYDSVATRRVTRKGEPKIRSFFARKFYKIMNNSSRLDMMDGARDYRLMKRKMVDAILSMSEHERFSKGIFGFVGFKTYWLGYENVERAAGKTKWNFFKLLKYAISGITDYSRLMLNFSLFSALLSIIAFICFLAWDIVLVSLKDMPFINNLFILSMIFFITSLILINIWILGLHVFKIQEEVKRRPHYIISYSNIEGINYEE